VTPPPIVGLANGVAQSIVSLARGFGPLLGGYVSAVSLSRYDNIFLTSLSPDMVCIGTRKPVELLHRVRDRRCGVFTCNRPQLFHPLKYTISAFWRGWYTRVEKQLRRPYTHLTHAYFFWLLIDSARLLASLCMNRRSTCST
jgi:hypothetical protein